MEKLESKICEILAKEYEKHELSYLGFPEVDPQEVARAVISDGGAEDGSGLKARALTVLYRMLGYQPYAERQKSKDTADRRFANVAGAYIKRELAWRVRHTPVTRLDKELWADESVSFYLSPMMFDDIYDDFAGSGELFADAGQLSRYFIALSEEAYPVGFGKFMRQLGRKDEGFWVRGVYGLIKKISSYVTKSNIWSSKYRDVAEDEIATESYLEMNRKVAEQDVKFNDESHFRRYVYKVCVNKTHEYRRRNKMGDATYSLEDDLQLPRSLKYEGGEPENGADIEVSDIDNEYEIARLAAVILLDTGHPMHGRLVDDDGEKVGLLIDVAVNGLSYDDVIRERYGEKALTPDESRRVNAGLRQEYVRIRRTIIKRLKQMLEDDGKVYPYRR